MEGYGKSNDDWMALFRRSLCFISFFFSFESFFFWWTSQWSSKCFSFFLSFTFPKSNKSAPELYIPHLGDHVGGHWSCDNSEFGEPAVSLFVTLWRENRLRWWETMVVAFSLSSFGHDERGFNRLQGKKGLRPKTVVMPRSSRFRIF